MAKSRRGYLTVPPLRRLAYLALVLGFAQVVFGAVVRITGSGMGCGDNWPDCLGSLTPVNTSPGLLIEISHRYGALALSLVGLIRTRQPAWAAGLVALTLAFGFLVWAYWVNPDPIEFLLATSAYRTIDPIVLSAAAFVPVLADRLLR